MFYGCPCGSRNFLFLGGLEVAEKRTTAANALIWLGAAISIAEIYTGTLMAPLGMAQGMLAVFLGHAAGGVLMYLTALIGGRTSCGAMESAGMFFGGGGAKFFAALNVLQLVGWTAVMIAGGAISLGIFLNPATGLNNAVWCAAIGVMIAIWIMLDMKNFERVNRAAMTALFLLTLLLSYITFGGKGAGAASGTLSFAEAIELSAAMPLSWLPLISDYMRDAEDPGKSAAISTVIYSIASCWMYFIGMGAAIYAGSSDVAEIMKNAGMSAAGIVIIIFSTVTTTFLDAYSAGISFHVIFPQIREKAAGVAVCAAGTFIAVFANAENYEGLLYLISSVFAPMAAVMITDYFLLGEKSFSDRRSSLRNLAVWAAGFAFYRYLMNTGCPIGATAPVILATAVLAWAAGKIFPCGKSAEM